MAEKTRQKTGSKTGSATLEFEDFELQSAMQDFLKEEPKEEGKGVWNFSTFAGLGMLFIAFTFLLQLIGFPMGQGLSAFAQDAISALPIIGGILVTLVGFGFLVGDRKKEKKAKKESRRRRKAQSKKNIYSSDIHGAEEFTSTLNNDLDSSKKSSSSSNYSYDNFGYRHAKRLMKSRTNKKIAGVCGGLAKYFGLSSTVVRFIFGAVFIMGWGTSLLIYIGLALAMPKEPIEMMDDFDF
ncbi:MAG: PspC domain-containing protein [Balneola sp.]|jgi:phage shock protein C